MERLSMKVSMYLLFFFSFLFLPSAQAMESDDLESQILAQKDTDPQQLDNSIISAIQTKKIEGLDILLQQRKECALMQVRSGDEISHQKKKKQVRKAFQDAQEAAEINVEAAKNNLGILTNTDRRNKVVVGFSAIGFGLGKGIYDFVQFWYEDTKTGANVFNLISDGSLMIGGTYCLKLAYENGGAKSEYNQALAIQYLVQQASKLEDK